MTQSSFTNFFNNSQPFGLNVRVPERTIKQIGDTAGNVAGGVLEPLFSYLEENENVFSGDIMKEFNKTCSHKFNTEMILNREDERTNGAKPTFDTRF